MLRTWVEVRRRALPLLRAFVLVLGVCSTGGNVHADPADTQTRLPPAAPVGEPEAGPAAVEPPGYRAAISAGLDEYARGLFHEARTQLLRALALFPNARVLRGLGKVEYELRNYGQAVRYLEGALASTVKPLDARLREETSKLLERARLYVGEVHIEVDPTTATVSVDGVTVARGPRASLLLHVGEHLLEFTAQGRLSERRSLRVDGGKPSELRVVLAKPPTDASASSPAAAASAPRADGSRRQRRWLWSLAAVTVVATAVLVPVLLHGRSPEYRTAGPAITSATLPGTVIAVPGD